LLPLEAGFEFAFATARTFVFRGFEATARAVLRSVDYMSLMLFYMANSFHLVSRNAPGTAWKSKPTWYIVANNDRSVHPDLQRFSAKRMGASIHAIDSSHVPMLSHPSFVVDVVRAAAKAVHGSSAVA
jgi:pimeloyl-ACP methyl ester carboxylesterase